MTTWVKNSNSDNERGGDGWELGSCISCPTGEPKGGGRYRLIAETRVGDSVIHIHDSRFAGHSIVAGELLTVPPPPNPGPWSYASEFYRVDLREFTKFRHQVAVADFLAEHSTEITREIETEHPKRYPFALFHYYRKEPMLKTVRGRFLTVATPLLQALIFDTCSRDRV